MIKKIDISATTHRKPVSPQGTAVWLLENTSLTFHQIAHYCCVHPLIIQAIADGQAANGIAGVDPIKLGQLTRKEIELCEADATRLPQIAELPVDINVKKHKSRYTHIAKRHDKPNAILWLLRNYPNIEDRQIAKLIGTTKGTISSIRNNTNWNIANITPRNPVLLGLCLQLDLDTLANTLSPNKDKS